MYTGAKNQKSRTHTHKFAIHLHIFYMYGRWGFFSAVIYYGQCIRVENFISLENCEWGLRPHSPNKCMFWHIHTHTHIEKCLFFARHTYLHIHTRTLFHTSLCSVFQILFSSPAALSLTYSLARSLACARFGCTENYWWFINGMCLIATLNVRNWNELDSTEVFPTHM